MNDYLCDGESWPKELLQSWTGSSFSGLATPFLSSINFYLLQYFKINTNVYIPGTYFPTTWTGHRSAYALAVNIGTLASLAASNGWELLSTNASRLTHYTLSYVASHSIPHW
jgi:hypothetical protein